MHARFPTRLSLRDGFATIRPKAISAVWLIASLVCVGTTRVTGADLPATVVNLSSGEPGPLLTVLKGQGLYPVSGDPGAQSFSGPLVVWQSKGTISDPTLAALGAFVQKGGSLLIGLDRVPGLGAMQLSFLSPTMAWETQRIALNRGGADGEIGTGHFDPEMFGPTTDRKSVTLPYFYPIRAFHTVERGAERYFALKSTNIFLGTPHAAGDFFWTRPLLNRDWTVRLQGNDRAATPLLMTGRYGAGRVAVFASGLDKLPPGAEPIFTPLLQWLLMPPLDLTKEPTAGMVQISSVVPGPAAGSVRVTLKNSGGSPLSLQVLDRLLTWEGAPVGDAARGLQLAANSESFVDLPVPGTGPLPYQALESRHAFVARIGVLSATGATLLAEKTSAVDFTPSTGVELSADNLYKVTYPYPNAPGLYDLGSFLSRMGAPVAAYAYPPGATVNATVVFTNGLRDLASLATVTDETTPDNPSAMALNSGTARMEKGPRDHIISYGTWKGVQKQENVVHFHFPTAVTLAGVTLMGNDLDHRGFRQHNPGAAIIEADGKRLVEATDLDARFLAEDGLAHLTFPPVQVTDLRIRLPWVEKMADGRLRLEPQLGTTAVMGSLTPLPPEATRDATLVLRDAMSGGETVLGTKNVTIPPGGRVAWTQAVPLPTAAGAHFYQLEVRCGAEKKQVPILAIQPQRTLLSRGGALDKNSVGLGFIVTRGFRNCFPLGTGTREPGGNWESPEDLIWAYSHLAKQTGGGTKARAACLYVTNADFGHYGTPWGHFPNGEAVFDDATPNFLAELRPRKDWKDAKKVVFGFSDRWDTGPAVARQYGWPEIVAFDESLRAQGGAGLTGRTVSELCDDIDRKHAAQWAAWQQGNYVARVQNMQKAFAAEGKQLVISGQGKPMTSNASAAVLAQTIQGMSDDNTWEMGQESVPMTTARQMVQLAYNPPWKLGMNLVWGWDSGIIGIAQGFAQVVGTTEASRRHYYDLAWRGRVDENGRYASSITYGYGANGDVSYVMAPDDWQQMWRSQERFSLLYPEAPLGAGFILSSSPVDRPDGNLFSGGGMGGSQTVDAEIQSKSAIFEKLHDAGLSIPFGSNILSLRHWDGNAPLIILDPAPITDEEVGVLKTLAARGVRIATFAPRHDLSAALAGLFGVTPTGQKERATEAGMANGKTLLANGNFLYLPFHAELMTLPQMQDLAPTLNRWLAMPITFPEGTMGYGFVSGGQKFVVLEDWMEKGRVASLRVHADGAAAKAVGLNDHASLKVTRDGADWLVDVPLRPGDGEVVVLQETK